MSTQTASSVVPSVPVLDPNKIVQVMHNNFGHIADGQFAVFAHTPLGTDATGAEKFSSKLLKGAGKDGLDAYLFSRKDANDFFVRIAHMYAQKGVIVEIRKAVDGSKVKSNIGHLMAIGGYGDPLEVIHGIINGKRQVIEQGTVKVIEQKK